VQVLEAAEARDLKIAQGAVGVSSAHISPLTVSGDVGDDGV